VLRKVDWRSLGALLGQVDWHWAATGFGLTFGIILLLAFRWTLFLKQQQFEVRFATIFGLTWAGQFFNSILPGSTGGDIVKIYQLCRRFPESKAAVAASVLADRLTALIILVGFAGLGFVLEPAPLQLLLGGRVSGLSIVKTGVMLVIVGTGGASLVWLILRRTRFIAPIRRVLTAVRQSFVFNTRFIVALASALALHVLNFSIVFVFAHSLGLTITYGQVLLMMPVILFLVMIPVTINGHGLREMLLIGYFTVLGITAAGRPYLKMQEIAVALSLLSVANDLLWSLPGGIWYLINFRTPATTSVAAQARRP
jgi:uncharacterized membrane protein YbhN (UPF0104 family)